MSLTTAGKNTALGALTLTTMSLHTAAPGDTGATGEATGGGYARKASTFAAAAAGARALSANVLFDVAAGTYTHYGIWNGTTCIDVGALSSSKVLAEAGQIEITAGSVSLT